MVGEVLNVCVCKNEFTLVPSSLSRQKLRERRLKSILFFFIDIQHERFVTLMVRVTGELPVVQPDEGNAFASNDFVKCIKRHDPFIRIVGSFFPNDECVQVVFG